MGYDSVEMHHGTHCVIDCHCVNVGYCSKLVLTVVAYVLYGLVYCHI